MMAMSLTVDTQALRQRLQALEAALVPTLAQALYTRAQRIMAASRPLVPVVTGALRASALVYPPEIEGSTITVVFGYGGQSVVYGAITHENPRAGRTGGISPTGRRYREGTFSTTGQYHFLSDPVRDMQSSYEQDVAQMMRDILRHGGLVT